MRRTPSLLTVIALVGASLGVVATTGVPASVAATAAASPCGTSHQARVTHVVWILLENEGYSVVGSSSAPYLNALATRCGLATNDDAVSHPSLPNYIALTSGSTQGITDDAEPSSHPLNVPSIFSELKGNWRALDESMPSACDRVTSGSYAARHNPAVYYTNLPTCSRDDVPLTLPLNLSAAFTMITPNVCNDMHSCPVSTGDAWLKSHVPQIVSSPQYRAGSLALFITFDESNVSSTNQVPTIVVAPSVPKGRRVGKSFTHYSLLRTTEALLHLPFLGGARSANSMVTPFHL
ncbi:MAG TPA: alkaline phosphatase family protein [Acidimicrobiales bacterium]